MRNIPELLDGDRHEHLIALPEIVPKKWRYRFRGWLIKQIVGDSPVMMNMRIYGRVANERSSMGALIENNVWCAADDNPHILTLERREPHD